MLHHLSLAVSNLERSAAFYDAVFAPLGYVRVWSDNTAVGYGLQGGGDKLALKLRPDGVTTPSDGCHFAFAAPSSEAVNLFYAAALQRGGSSEEPPRLWPEYGDRYYAAFVLDPDGYRIEAVTRAP